MQADNVRFRSFLPGDLLSIIRNGFIHVYSKPSKDYYDRVVEKGTVFVVGRVANMAAVMVNGVTCFVFWSSLRGNTEHVL